jgi:hypothetical protein
LAADRNRAQRIATISGRRDNPQQFETHRNQRQQQKESQAAKNPVVEHKGTVEHWWLVFALRSFDLSALCGATFHGVCSTRVRRPRFLQKPQVLRPEVALPFPWYIEGLTFAKS